jgi:integrase
MSLYKRPRSPFYHYEFIVRGNRLRGSTGTSDKREAKAIEKAAHEDAIRAVPSTGKAATTSMRFSDVAVRYFDEVGQHLAGDGADNCKRDLKRLHDYFGASKLLTAIDNDDIAKLVAWRRGQQQVRLKKIKGKLVQNPKAPLITAATVNRSTTEVLKKLFIRARDTWGVKFDHWPKWGDHVLKEAAERVRELHEGEGEAIMEKVRDDYAPLIEFAHATGMRQKEAWSLEWSQVNFGTKLITTHGKGDRLVTKDINDEVRAIIWPLVGHHPTRVFTYIAKKTRDGRVAGKRYPLTKEGVKTIWKRTRTKAGLDGGKNRLRFHDLRHDFGTKLLRETGNLKLVQKALGHADVETTMRYAHVLNEEVASAVAKLAKNRMRKTAASSPHTTPHTGKSKAKKALQINA